MWILGIDPGTAACGFALVRADIAGVSVADLGTFVTVGKAKAGAAKQRPEGKRLRDRFAELAGDICGLLDDHPLVVAVVVEAPTFPKGTLAAAQVWGAYCAVLGLARGRRLRTFALGAAEWRRELGLAVESGDAEGRKARKDATGAELRRRYPGIDALLESTKPAHREHAIDALAITEAWLRKARPTKRGTSDNGTIEI